MLFIRSSVPRLPITLGQLGEVAELKNILLTEPLKGNFAKLLYMQLRLQNLKKMAKKTKAELAETWAKNNNICGENPWWDKNKTYYNLTVEQILKMAKYIETKSKVIDD